MWVVIAAALLLGLALTGIGVRGRRTDDHPLCRRCRFDLTGRPDGAERRCPECGADLARPRAVVVGHWRRRPDLLGGGLAVLLVAVGWGGWTAWAAAANVRWIEHAPVWYLLRRGTSADPATRSSALGELWARFCDKRLSTDGLDRTVAVGLAYQGDASKPWDRLWGVLIEAADTDGRLPTDLWQRYARQACAGTYTFRVRPRVRLGDPLPYELVSGPMRTASYGDGDLWCEPVRLRLTWSANRVRITDGPAHTVAARRPGTTISGSVPEAQIDPAWRPGPHTVHLSFDVNVGPLDPHREAFRRHHRHAEADPSGPEDRAGVDNPVAVASVDLSAAVDLLPPDQPSFRRVHDPSLATEVGRSLHVDSLTSSPAGTAVGWSVVAPGPPTGISFDIIATDATGPVFLGGFAVDAGPAGLGHWSPDLARGGTGIRLGGRRADVVFRADPAAAVRTVDVLDVWDGRVVFHDVPVQ